MVEKKPSKSAIGAAAHRAAHQILEGGSIFADPLAAAILGSDSAHLITKVSEEPAQLPMRLFIAARSRFAEDCLASAVSHGVRQAVILGAGLETFALRNPHGEAGLRMFEVDHPGTQAWKQARIAEAGIEVPSLVTFVPISFERQSLAEALPAAGFLPGEPAFFMWLGVTPFLHREAVFAVLQYIAQLPGSEVVFDYTEPIENYPEERRMRVAAVAARMAEMGEPWLCYLEPAMLLRELHELRFGEIEDLRLSGIAARYYGGLVGEIKDAPGPHLLNARHTG